MPFNSVTEKHAAVIINPRRSLAPHQTELTEFTYEEHVVLFNQQPEFSHYIQPLYRDSFTRFGHFITDIHRKSIVSRPTADIL
jgi:hypothetical protein